MSRVLIENSADCSSTSPFSIFLTRNTGVVGHQLGTLGASEPKGGLTRGQSYHSLHISVIVAASVDAAGSVRGIWLETGRAVL